LGILIFKGLTERRLYKSFGVKGLALFIYLCCFINFILFYFVFFIFGFTLSLFSLNLSQNFLLRSKIFLNFPLFYWFKRIHSPHTSSHCIPTYFVVFCKQYLPSPCLLSLYNCNPHFHMFAFHPSPPPTRSFTLPLTALFRSTRFLVFLIFPHFYHFGQTPTSSSVFPHPPPLFSARHSYIS
jgi:hypothetical protein